MTRYLLSKNRSEIKTLATHLVPFETRPLSSELYPSGDYCPDDSRLVVCTLVCTITYLASREYSRIYRFVLFFRFFIIIVSILLLYISLYLIYTNIPTRFSYTNRALQYNRLSVRLIVALGGKRPYRLIPSQKNSKLCRPKAVFLCYWYR